jgi:hypothetical protein
MRYVATLFRGWEVVHMQYDLQESAVVMNRHRTWKGRDSQTVELASLSGEVRRVWGRQPAYVYSTVVLVVVLLILGIDTTMHGVGAQAMGMGGTSISWALWGPLLAIGGLAYTIFHKTRKPAEWSHFVGSRKGGGLFILRDPRNAQAHDKLVAAIRRHLPEQ